MNLLELKIACYLYNKFTDYDRNYLQLYKDFPELRLNEQDHIKALIKWLRTWGCRQFKKKDEDLSIRSIREWYESKRDLIPDKNLDLLNYEIDRNREVIIKLFDDLCQRQASIKDNRRVKIGPVGTAKILFALRPKLFAPWDTPIYKALKLKGNGFGYVDYLSKIQKELKELKDSLNETTGIRWHELFNYLEKQHNSYSKLIDEYYWITITHKCNPKEIINFCSYKKQKENS